MSNIGQIMGNADISAKSQQPDHLGWFWWQNDGFDKITSDIVQYRTHIGQMLKPMQTYDLENHCWCQTECIITYWQL